MKEFFLKARTEVRSKTAISSLWHEVDRSSTPLGPQERRHRSDARIFEAERRMREAIAREDVASRTDGAFAILTVRFGSGAV